MENRWLALMEASVERFCVWDEDRISTSVMEGSG